MLQGCILISLSCRCWVMMNWVVGVGVLGDEYWVLGDEYWVLGDEF